MRRCALPPQDVTLKLVQEHGLLEQLLKMLHGILSAAVSEVEYARTVDIERLRMQRAPEALNTKLEALGVLVRVCTHCGHRAPRHAA